MLKNASPRIISFYTSATIAGFFLLVNVLFGLIFNDELIWLPIVLQTLIIFLVSYLVFLYALTRYIYRKIKLIYKSIHKFKRATKKNLNAVDLSSDIIGEVEQEVSQWAADQAMEIESLKTLEAYRREFIGNVSHELKTPIFSLQGYLHTLMEGALYDEKINMKYVKRAVKNAERLQTIVEDLDAISKIESGQLDTEADVFDIKMLVEEVFDEVEIQAAENKSNLIFKEGANTNFNVIGDRNSIRQVLVNLIINSVKYGKYEGTTKVSFYDMDKYILIEVADNGDGIDQEHLPHLFDRFYRVDRSRSRHAGGSGLGLSIVKHIIEAHKQTINVRSTKGAGSTFGFTLAKA